MSNRYPLHALLIPAILILSLIIPSAGLAAAKNDLPLVAVVTTGGTVAMKKDPETGGAVPAVSGQDLMDSVPGLAKLARIKIYPFCNIDSSQMSPERWLKLSAKVDEILKDPAVKGVVVTHGTDTMACGAFFLDVTLESGKPVVFTGAMRDASDISSDGPLNIYNAVKQVTLQDNGQWGVTLTMNQFVSDAYDVRKVHTTNAQCFSSGPAGYLGYVGGAGLARYRRAMNHIKLSRPEKLPAVCFVGMIPGDDGKLMRAAVDLGYKGIVVQGVGAGNVNQALFEAIKYAKAKKVAVVLLTQVYYGGVQAIYGDTGGGVTLKKAGCILGGRFTPNKAAALLTLGLANYGNSEKLASLFE